jgi:hypothetical protein
MKQIIIYRSKEDGSITNAYLAHEKFSVSELNESISKINAKSDSDVVSRENVPNELIDAITFLTENRNVDINSHIEELKDLKRDLSDVSDSVYNAITRLEKRIEKDDEDSN